MAVLEITNLKKSYTAPDGERAAVIDVEHFSILDGQQLALQGGSGSGKTTLLNLIAGILRADSGRIVIGGEDMASLGESRRDRLRGTSIGYVFQTFNLLQGYTALENVTLAMAFGKGIDHNLAGHLLERVGLKDRMDYRPRQLSVGQQQRVAVARALANQPMLVLADEPTGNLDRRNAEAALSLISDICRENNAALLLVSHDPFALGRFKEVRQLSEINLASTERANTPGVGKEARP